MKKRLLSVLLAGALLYPAIPVRASEDTEPPLHTVSFTTIRAEVEARNPVLKVNTDDYSDGQDSAEAALKLIKQQESFVDTTIAGLTNSAYFDVGTMNYADLPEALKALIPSQKLTSVDVLTKKGDPATIYGISTAMDSAGNPIWMILPQPGPTETTLVIDSGNSTVDLAPALSSMYLNIIGLYESQVRAIEAQYNTVADQKGQSWKNILQLKQGSDQLVWAAQQLLLSYAGLEDQIQTLSVQQELLLKQSEVGKLQLQLGLTTPIEQTNIEANLSDLNFAIKSLTQSQEMIKENLNILLGQDYNTPLTIDALPTWDSKKLGSVVYENDLEQALDKSFNVLLAYNEDNETRTEQQKRSLRGVFDQQSKDITLKVEALKLEQTKLENEQLKLNQANLQHRVGMISDITLAAAKLPYQTQFAKVETAEDNLLKVYTQYQWLLEGFNVAGSNAQ